ncbi:hypothetical protein WMY93_027642 [Mugilogobius chulae]|uniref:Uncharacterized protein n=1 Tax=Mugilogobius chulae TaxID=88201 RepID=A0AAW0N097_9GOBI
MSDSPLTTRHTPAVVLVPPAPGLIPTVCLAPAQCPVRGGKGLIAALGSDWRLTGLGRPHHVGQRSNLPSPWPLCSSKEALGQMERPIVRMRGGGFVCGTIRDQPLRKHIDCRSVYFGMGWDGFFE